MFMFYANLQQTNKLINFTSRLSDIWNVISVKLYFIFYIVSLHFHDINIGNVLPVILNGIRVGYTVQFKGQGFQEENI